MRWLWQYGTRWVGSRLWSEATRAATEEAAKTATDDSPAGSPVAMALLCETQLLYDAVADDLSSKRVIDAAHMVLARGKLSGVPVVVVRPQGGQTDVSQVVTAVVDGHAPRFALSAAEAVCLDDQLEPGSLVMATRVIDKDGSVLRLEGGLPAGDGLQPGAVATIGSPATEKPASQEELPKAEDAWSARVARACQQAGLPLVVASAVLQPSASRRSRETESLRQQKSLAGQAGVLAGMLLKKRSGLRDLWNEKQAKWEASSRLANLARHLASAAQQDRQQE